MRKKLVLIIISLCLIFSLLTARIGYIVFGGEYAVNEGVNSLAVTVDKREYNLYYSDIKPLTNNIKKRIAVIRPSQKSIGELTKAFSLGEVSDITQELKLGKPVVKEIDKDTELKYSTTYNSCDTLCTCTQLISKESAGLLSHIDHPRYERRVNFSVDALGRMLSGDTGTLMTNDGFYSREGLVLTLDEKIQELTYEACKGMKSGCAVVMRVEDSAILSCVTKPDDSYLNKPFSQYSVGSVFKVAVAACALENGMDNEFECTSSITVGDTVYTCQKDKAHGKQHLKEALENSCNCYFVNLALTLGADKLSKTLDELDFNGKTTLYNGFEFKNARLPSETDLKSRGELSLLGFGQGKLTAAPFAICNLLCTVADGGYYKSPYLIKGSIDGNGVYKEYEHDNKKAVMRKESADTLLTYLRGVVENGTGKAADYNGNSAGKTATAQTGQFENGREILNTWFAGVYPYDNPEYAIVIMYENGTSGASDCCPIFRTIVENLDRM